MKENVYRCTAICLALFSLTCLAIAIALPYIIDKIINNKIHDQITITKDNQGLWAQIPGDSGVPILREFYFYNFTNPDDVLYLQKTPELVRVGPYVYQEFINKSNVSIYYDNSSQSEIANYTFWNYFKKVNGTNDSDLIQTINLGTTGAWYNMKNAQPAQITLRSFALLITNLENILYPLAITQGIYYDLMNQSRTQVQNLIFQKANIDPSKYDWLWNDPIYGFSKWETMYLWIIAVQENQNSQGDSYQILQDYFQLSSQQIFSMLNGILSTWVKTVEIIIQQNYCNNISVPCDKKYIAALQWSQTQLTQNPPSSSIPKYDSIIYLNQSLQGYVEINYFLKSYFLQNIENPQDYQQVSFTPEWTLKIFNHSDNFDTWYTQPYLIIHIGNLQYLFEQGYTYDQSKNSVNKSGDMNLLNGIQSRFLLDNIYQTRVFWEYMKYSYNNFTVKSQINGTKGFVSMAFIQSQKFYNNSQLLQKKLHQTLLSQVLIKNLSSLSCNDLFSNSITGLTQSQQNQICQTKQNVDVDLIARLIQICKFPYRGDYNDFQQLNNLTNLNMKELCDPNANINKTSFAPNLQKVQLKIAQFYNCNASNISCSDREIGVKQWGSSQISLNVLPELQTQFNKSYTVNSQFPNIFDKPFEYYYTVKKYQNYDQQKNISVPYDYSPLSDAVANEILSFDNFYNLINQQYALIYDRNEDYQGFSKKFNFNFTYGQFKLLPRVMSEFLINNLMNGFSHVRNVSDLIWGYNDTFLWYLKTNDKKWGGDPSIPNIVQSFKNFSWEDAQSEKQQIYTGKENLQKVGYYKSIYDLDYITVREEQFNGNETYYLQRNPWAEQVKINGTDSTHNGVFLKETDQSLIYVSDQYRGGYSISKNNEQIQYNDLNTFRFWQPSSEMNKCDVQNNQTDNCKFYMNKWNGIENFTSVKNCSLLISGWNFYLGDNELVNLTKVYSDQNKTSLLNNSIEELSFEDIEPYSGVAIHSQLKIQINYEHNQDELFQNQTYSVIPIFALNRHGQWPDSAIDAQYGQLKSGLKVRKIVPIGLYALFGVLFVSLVILVIYRRNQRAKEASGDQNERYQKLDA